MPKMKVMIVDDEDAACKGMIHRVERMGFEEISGIYSCSRASQAIEEISNSDGDWIVITDICMPDMDGLEMIREIRKRSTKVYFIIFSAYEKFSYAQEAVKLGAVDYLIKPCSFSELFDTIV